MDRMKCNIAKLSVRNLIPVRLACANDERELTFITSK
jgi:hypothetical protein